MYSSRDGEGPIAVLTPVEIEEEPQPERSLTPVEAQEPESFEPVVPEEQEDVDIRPKGLLGFFRGRISVKIVAPFVFVMFVLAIGGSWVVLNLVTGNLVTRFQNQLLDAGKNVNDGIIKVEGQQLELLRLMSNTEGVDTALKNGDAPVLQKLLVPLQANSTFSFVDVVDPSGRQVLALRPNDPKFAQTLDPDIGTWDVTQKSLKGEGDTFGNKWTELVNTSFGKMVYTGGPVKDDDDKVVGAILVAVPFDDLIKQLTKDVVAQITVYTTDGDVFGSSFKNPPVTLEQGTLEKIFAPEPQTVQRPVTVDAQSYMELVGGLVVRDKVAGGLGVAISTNSIDKAGDETRKQMIEIFTGVTFVVMIIGLVQARRISSPIRILVDACRKVAHGQFDQKVDIKTVDETGVLAQSFNQMIDGLKERDKIKDTFGRYMTQQVSDAILKGDVKLGGETRELTMLMSDIRSFTTLSETMHPEDLVGFLNRYFSKMIDCVMTHDGVVDKFMGDAILVVYGAPVMDPTHPMKAVLTALDMRQALIEFNDELGAEGHPPIRIGIGTNTGSAVTGNIGSEVRMEYTVIGDTVNATQRTEDLTKEYKTDILINETTAARLDGRFILGAPHAITLRGRHQESLIYPVIGIRHGDPEQFAGQRPTVVGGDSPRSWDELAEIALQPAEPSQMVQTEPASAENLVHETLKVLTGEQPVEAPESNGHADKQPKAKAAANGSAARKKAPAAGKSKALAAKAKKS
ncbi:MAG TPA: adenylate/guanylate cyclase domain-containing protein [Chloroflexota bacterium]|nr:adenylate/guanylate cyclase domain-containing protein [Chloroflexota bacterium]